MKRTATSVRTVRTVRTAAATKIVRPALLGRLAVKTDNTCRAARRGGSCGSPLFVIAEAERKNAAEAQAFCHLHGYQA